MRKNSLFKASLFLVACLLLCFAIQGALASETTYLTISDVTQNEGNAGTVDFTFTVSLSAPAGPGGVTFDIATASNTALSSIDYFLNSFTSQTIPAGSSTYTFAVMVSGDTTAEENESFFVNVTNVTGAGVSDGQGIGTIVNDDPPNLTISDETTIEGNAGGTTNATCVVSLSVPAGPGGVTFDIATANGTATAPSDYTAISLTGQVIPQGSKTYYFYVPVNCDTMIEANESFTVNITNVSGANVTDGQANVVVINDDYPALSINDVTVNEGDAGTASFTFTVSLSSPALTGGVTFDIATANGTAAAPSDYTAKSLTGQAIPAGASTYTFTVLASGDTAIEANENFFVNVTNVTNAYVSDGQGTGTLTNDDFPKLTIDDATVAEGSTGTKYIYFSILLSEPAGPGGITLDIATADGTAASPSDYEEKSLTGLTVPAGSSTYTLSVVANCDTAIEADENFYVNITNVTGAIVVDGQAIGTITNDDFPVLTINNVTVNEGNSGTAAVTFIVSLTEPAGPGGVTFDIATVSDTAVSPADYTAKGLTSQTIAAGESTYTFDVLVKGDSTVEANESFFVNIANVSGATVSDNQGICTITNDDAAFLTIDDVTVNEGNAGTTTATFTISLSSPAGPGGVTFDIETANGTAAAPSDYTAKSLISQTIAEGESTYTFTVLAYGDTAVEANESFFVNVTHVAGASVSDSQGLGTIINDDGTALSITDVSVNEGNSGTTDLIFTISLSSPAGPGGVTFDIETANGTAATPSDYMAKSLTSQTIAEGESTYTFTVLANGDTAVEANESFFVNVTHVAGASVSDSQGLGTIINDDGTALSITDVSVNEGNSGTTDLIFTISLSSPAGPGGVTFDIETANGTAATPSDYMAKSLTSQTIAEGESTYTFTVLANGDTTVEANESFFVNVTHVAGASVSDSQGLGTIINDDADMTAPTVGGNGSIHAKNVTKSTIDLSWTAGSDADSPSANLQYKVVRSLRDNIGTVQFAQENGTVVTDWSYNATSYTATGLKPSTRYYFTVIVMDEAGNKAVYEMVSKTTLESQNATSDASSAVQNTVSIFINGNEYLEAENKTNEDGQTVGTVALSKEFMDEKIEDAIKENPSEADNLLHILVPDTSAQVIKIVLPGETFQKLRDYSFRVNIENGNMQYILPVMESGILSALQDFGITDTSMHLVQMTVKMIKLDSLMEKYRAIVNTDGYKLVGSPVKIEITAQVTQPNGYLSLNMVTQMTSGVQLNLAVPDGIDAKHAVGIAIFQNDTYQLVPTKTLEDNGKWYLQFSVFENASFAVVSGD